MLVHDLLAATFVPVWFADFATAAARHGLAYVGDAIPGASREAPWSEAVEAFVAEGAGDDRIAREQYFDLMVLRRFRHSLLCHEAQAPSARVDPAAVPQLLVAPDGETAELPEPLRGALAGASRLRPLAFAELRERTGLAEEALAAQLVDAFDVGDVEFSAVPPPAAAEPGERPRASALARSQAGPGALVTTLLSQLVRVTDEPTAVLLRLLDGTRDRAGILDAFPGPLDQPSLDAALAGFAELGLLHLAAGPDQLVEVLEVRLQGQPPLLAELLGDGPDQVAHRDRALLVGGLERRGQRAVADRAAGELELGREELEVDVVVERRLLRQQQPPDQLAVVGLGEREVDHEVEPAHERVVDVLAEVRREDDRAGVALHLLQQVGDLDVGVAVGASETSERFPNRASASSKKRIALEPVAASKMRSRFFSVSPMYFDTIVERSTRKSSSPSSAPSTSAAIVLPVPDPPATAP